MKGYWPCKLCGRQEEAGAIQEQCGFNLCRSCYGKHSDEELKDKYNEERKEYLAFIDKYDPTGEMTRALKANIALAKKEEEEEE